MTPVLLQGLLTLCSIFMYNFSMHSWLSSEIRINIVHLNIICFNHCLYGLELKYCNNSSCYMGGEVYLLSPTDSYDPYSSHTWQGRKWNSVICYVDKPCITCYWIVPMPILQSLHLGMRLWVKLFMSLSETYPTILCSLKKVLYQEPQVML